MKQVTYTTRKTILSILALVLTFIALGTTTFAWFSLSTVSKINQISGEVRGGEGLSIRLVSLDNPAVATEWKANLSEQDVADFIALITVEEMKFTAVSGNEVGVFKKQAPDGNKLYIDGANAVRGTDYLQFKIEFKSDTEGKVVLQSYEFTGTEGKLKTPVPFKDSGGVDRAVGYEVIVDASNAARFALVEKDDDEVNESIYQKPALIDGNVANNNVRLEGQWDFLRAVGEELYINDANIEGTGVNASLVYDDVKDIEFLEAVTAVDGKEYLLEQSGTEYVASIEITIWLEGWDVDAYDVIYNAYFYLDLTFVKETLV